MKDKIGPEMSTGLKHKIALWENKKIQPGVNFNNSSTCNSFTSKNISKTSVFGSKNEYCDGLSDKFSVPKDFTDQIDGKNGESHSSNVSDTNDHPMESVSDHLDHPQTLVSDNTSISPQESRDPIYKSAVSFVSDHHPMESVSDHPQTLVSDNTPIPVSDNTAISPLESRDPIYQSAVNSVSESDIAKDPRIDGSTYHLIDIPVEKSVVHDPLIVHEVTHTSESFPSSSALDRALSSSSFSSAQDRAQSPSSLSALDRALSSSIPSGNLDKALSPSSFSSAIDRALSSSSPSSTLDGSPSTYLASEARILGVKLPPRNEAVSNYWKKQALKLELDLKEEKLNSVTRELNDLQFTGKDEEEVAILKKAKHDLELRVKDQEEELDDLAGQVQMLEGAKVRLEMSIEQMRKENRKESALREEEMEEIRIGAQKKIKTLEAHLETEHEERTILVREKHDLERRLNDAQTRSISSVDEDAFYRLKKELKKTKALLKDTQTMLEKTQNEGSNKLLIRQLKTQLEDAEFAKSSAIKSKQSMEAEVCEVQSQLEESLRIKKDIEDKLIRVTKDKSDLQSQLEESEEEVIEVMKKYKVAVSQLSVDQVNISEQSQLIADLEHDKHVLQERLNELSSKMEILEGETANVHMQRRLQIKIKELESKLELELTTRQRMESQISRFKDQQERLNEELDQVKGKEMNAVDQTKKLNRQLREVKDDVTSLQQKLTEASNRRQEVEKRNDLAESEIVTLKGDLKLAFKRIEDLQQALQGDISDSDCELSDSDSGGENPLSASLTRRMLLATHTKDLAKTKDRQNDSAKTDSESKCESHSPLMSEVMAVIDEDDEELESVDYKESFA